MNKKIPLLFSLLCFSLNAEVVMMAEKKVAMQKLVYTFSQQDLKRCSQIGEGQALCSGDITSQLPEVFLLKKHEGRNVKVQNDRCSGILRFPNEAGKLGINVEVLANDNADLESCTNFVKAKLNGRAQLEFSALVTK